jgi:hypothetical protein
MKITLTRTLPINESHGAVEGATFNCHKVTGHGHNQKYWAKDAKGNEFAAFKQEVTVTEA